ncbi:MAG: complex I subunit 5 family protein [Gammaproteobacteria bacterium]
MTEVVVGTGWGSWLPVAVVASSLLTGVFIFFLGEARHGLRILFNLTGALVKLVVVGIMLWGVLNEHQYRSVLPLLPGIELVLRADALAMLFVTLSALLWFFTTIYAIGYLQGSPYLSRFFGFFSLCVTATVGIALSGNLLTFFIFYELLTLSTYPLVVHRGTPQALAAGNNYLIYTIGGGAVLLVGIGWLYAVAGNVEFTHGGALDHLDPGLHPVLIAIFALLIAGLGVKAALVPLHGWLPKAMVAPAPVSALLHAVAVVKAGAFGIVRVVYDVYGVEFAQALGVLSPLAWLAGITIIYGSLRALAQDDLKRRLAFSTVSQVSYITLGVALFGPLGTIGGVVHLVHQGLMKITLFFCAGNLAETLGIHKVSEMNGVGRRMPWTMTAFTLGALGMIGVPPLAGFISKWYLGLGAVAVEKWWVLGVLAASSLLNAAYFLPILYRAWFLPSATWPEDAGRGRYETRLSLLVPTLATGLLVLLVGLLANMPLSPLAWAQLIAERQYRP